MTNGSDDDRLTGAERNAFLATMRRAPIVQPTRPAAPARGVERDVAFDTLPGFKMMKTQRATADLLGIGNPFYQLHSVRAGERSVIGERSVLNFASYDYLGLNGHPEITDAVARAAEEWGTSVSASRLTAGERPFHRALEAELAEFYGAEDALVFVGGHATNVSTIGALVGPKDLLIHDALAHNSIIVGAELSKANRRFFPHNDLDALEQILATSRDRHERCLIVTEGLFSMDGDGPDLARLIEIKARWGAWLMMDEAHSLGVLGRTGRGIFEEQDVDPSGVDIWMGTLSKTLVGCGGYIAGSSDLVTYLKFHASGMVYSVGLPAPTAIGSLTALRLLKREPDRVEKLQANGQRFLRNAREAGLDTGESWGYAVTPVIIGDSLRTALLAKRLLERGINAFPIIPPGVPEKSARLRFFISASHGERDIDEAVAAVAEELGQLEADGISVSSIAALIE